jgi:glucosylceramidase
MYTYVKEGDKTLSTFSLDHDQKFKIPMIREAMKVQKNIKLFASPWSPPAFMKDNNQMLQGGKLKPEFYPVWANYFIKFINGYENSGIPVWGISVQNEPMAKQTWESCIYTAEEELDFIKNHLGPALHKNKMKNIKLIAWDHNRDLIYQRASTYLNDKKAAKYIWGIGFHWYEVWNGMRQFDNVRRVYESFPEHKLLLTEACNYPFDWKTFDEWQWGENYGENMIQDFNNGAVAWTDWNILLDEKGGPNHVNNFCFAPVHAKTNENSIHQMNSFYYIGHFSKFLQPGAKRIISSSNRGQLLTTAFQNPDGKIWVVVMNKTEESFEYELILKQKGTKLQSPAHSIATILIE